MNFLIRSVTSIVFVAIISACLLSGRSWSSYLCMFIVYSCTQEFITIVNKMKGLRVSSWRTILAALLLLTTIMTQIWQMASTETHYTGFFAALFLLSLLFLMSCTLFTNSESATLDLAVSLMSLLYIALPVSTIHILGFWGGKLCSTEFNGLLPLTVFIFIWCNDTGAYCVGCTLGKHRLFPRISPKKSWEGSIGGAIVTIGVAILLPILMPSHFRFLDTWIWVAVAILTVIAGTFGDLTESMIKRELGIKDSGRALPGHGGFLDRFDSTLFAFPAATALLYLIL